MKITLTRAQVFQMEQFVDAYTDAYKRGTVNRVPDPFENEKAPKTPQEYWQEQMGPDMRQLPISVFPDGSVLLDYTPKDEPKVVDAEVVKETPKKAKPRAIPPKAKGKNGRAK